MGQDGRGGLRAILIYPLSKLRSQILVGEEGMPGSMCQDQEKERSREGKEGAVCTGVM